MVNIDRQEAIAALGDEYINLKPSQIRVYFRFKPPPETWTFWVKPLSGCIICIKSFQAFSGKVVNIPFFDGLKPAATKKPNPRKGYLTGCMHPL